MASFKWGVCFDRWYADAACWNARWCCWLRLGGKSRWERL